MPSPAPLTTPASPFSTPDAKIAGVALALPGATLAGVSPNRHKLTYHIAGIPTDFTSLLAADKVIVSGLAVIRATEQCLRHLQAHQKGPR